MLRLAHFRALGLLRTPLRRFASTVPDPRGPVVVDRELPDPLAYRRRMRNGFAVFMGVMMVAVFGMIKYEDANSPVVSSTLYTLRRSDKAREALGENIRFASTMPWIHGSAGIAKNEVEFSYKALGTKGTAMVHFHAYRVHGENRYAAAEWELILDDGERINLLQEEFHPFVPGPKDEPGMQRH